MRIFITLMRIRDNLKNLFANLKTELEESLQENFFLRRAPLSTRALSISPGATLPLCTAAIEVSETGSR